ncbi:MAG TPA: BadF/BadG/BcrA/BcrD ATPase family protein [Candidatus Limnocylindria bacterium]|nr:BadF/BadG/BcrA/BcrD ATPase family protein [Candidatus Limnocylindria bacterium]
MSAYLAGIDGGQSSTTAVVVRDDGTLLGRGIAGPAAHVDEPPGSTTCADACASALGRALDAAGLPRTTTLAAVHVGLSGWDEAFDGAPLTLGARSIRLGHDAPIALAGAVASRPALVVIAGTGSVAYGEDGAGNAVRVGGWGYLFGDAGSAFAIARDALAYAMDQDDRGASSPLGEAALAFFDRGDLRALATAAMQGRISRGELAAFARVVHDAARLGDAEARALVDGAADALATLAATALERLGVGNRSVPVALAGGSFASERFFTHARERLVELAPGARVIRPLHEAAVGAALLAFAEAGLTAPDRIVEP